MGAVAELTIEQGVMNRNFGKMSLQEIGEELQKLKFDGITYADIAKQVGYDRTNISTFANQFTATENVRTAVVNFLCNYYNMPSEIVQTVFKKDIGIFPTTEFKRALGFIDDIRKRRKLGCIIGSPGSGKTTLIKEYAKSIENVVYIEAFEGMRETELLEIMADSLGIDFVKGSLYKKTKHIIDGYDGKEIMFVIDEAEYLEKWDVSKFETLRKIWDNTKIPIIFVGTDNLEATLTKGGNSNKNLSQLYRRIYKMRFEGIREKEVREILSQYNLEREAENLLVALAIDYKHGGMGNFTEVLELCLQQTKGDIITTEIVRNAKSYKLLY